MDKRKSKPTNIFLFMRAGRFLIGVIIILNNSIMVNKEKDTVFFKADHVIEVRAEMSKADYDDVLPELYYQ